MSRKRPLTPPPSSAAIPSFTRSNPIEDRASTFVALYSTTLAPRALQSEPSLATASHRILAWRKPSAQQSILASSSQSQSQQQRHRLYETGYDDGEKYAGKKLEKLLESMRVEGAVVVARWYGGVLLGPVRFTHIEAVAKEAVVMAMKGVSAAEEGDGASKRMKTGSAERDEGGEEKRSVEEEKEERARLAGVLEKRDESILALRVLLAEKKEKAAKANREVESGEGVSQKSPLKPPLDYARMPMPVLKRLEKARDATIGWILKEIDKAEKEASTT